MAPTEPDRFTQREISRRGFALPWQLGNFWTWLIAGIAAAGPLDTPSAFPNNCICLGSRHMSKPNQRPPRIYFITPAKRGRQLAVHKNNEQTPPGNVKQLPIQGVNVLIRRLGPRARW